MSGYTGFGDRLATRFGSRVGRWQDSARRARAGINAPKPSVRVDTRRAAPAWLFRIGCLALGALVIIALAPGIPLIVILSGLTVLVAIRPSAATGAVFCSVLGLFWMIDPSPPNSLRQVAILALAPALWTLAGVIADLPLRTRVEIAVFRVPGIRFLALQVIAQSVLIGAQLLHNRSAGANPMIIGALVLALVLIMAVGAWLLFPRFSDDANDQ
jgi:hypothetical protein